MATSDAPGASGNGTTFEAGAAGYKVLFPEGSKATFDDALYEVLSTRVEPRNPGELSLALTVRITNDYFAPVNFWNATFLLLVDGLGRAPESELSEVVPSGASEEGEVEFAIPEASDTLVLRFRHHREEVDLPLDVRPA